MRRVAIFGLPVLALLTNVVVSYGQVSDDALSRQKEALDVIQQFADGFCKVVPQAGKSTTLEASGDAKAQLSSLLKKLTDMGFEGAAKYKSEEWQGPLRENLERMVKDNASCRLEIWKDLQSKLLKPSASYAVPKLVQFLESGNKKNRQLEAVIQNDSDRDFLVTGLIVGKGYDLHESALILICCMYCMQEKTYVFDKLVSFQDTPLETNKVVGFADADEPKYRYPARYYMTPGCSSPLSYTLAADIAFQVKKESFTSLRIRIPYEPSNGIPYESSSTLDKTAKPVKLKPRSAFETNAFCIELAITGVAENLRSCKKLEHVDLIPKR